MKKKKKERKKEINKVDCQSSEKDKNMQKVKKNAFFLISQYFGLHLQRVSLREINFWLFTFQTCKIVDCGELPADFDMANFRQDETGDTYADYPADSNIDFASVSMVVLITYVMYVAFTISLTKEGTSD